LEGSLGFVIKGKIGDSDSSSDDDNLRKFRFARKAPKFGFGFGHASKNEIDVPKEVSGDIGNYNVLFLFVSLLNLLSHSNYSLVCLQRNYKPSTKLVSKEREKTI
jgi:hypothetical protein